jgi:aldehyde dehydrogenase (NAD+)
MSTAISTVSTSKNVQRIFLDQQKNSYAVAQATYSERKAKLNRLLDAVMNNKPAIREALYKDFQKHESEVDLTEIYPVTNEIKHALSHLRSWMKTKSVGTPLALIGSSSYIKYEPKGVVLLISPWNFPFNLTFAPLISAIAAGNCVMIKPSEMTPHTSALMSKLLGDLFPENEISVLEGDASVAKELLDLPFNHIFFTGAPSIGKVVMAAAAKNLTSVTLELGGKSPTIIDETANIATTAKRIAWAKFLNNGQICIAPDYIFVHESRKDEFVKAVKENIEQFYGENPESNSSYNRIVNTRHFERIKSYVEDAVSNGAKILHGGRMNSTTNYIEPTIVTEMEDQSKLMTEEIFGPILPIKTFKNLSEVTDYINKGEKPLALYIYSKSDKNIDFVLNNTRAGGSVINHSAMHFFNNNLPFGGSNNSGIGKSHGFFGFEAFSNARGVLRQHLPFSAIELMMPPYSNLKQKLIDLTIKWF